MILYVNGDSHTAAAEAVNPHAFAIDDPELFYMGRAPHPENLAISWGTLLSRSIRAGFHCGAESASSNTRILRTTREWLDSHYSGQDELLMIIQWSTWEREEWQDEDGTYYQVNASGIDDVPESLQLTYKNYIANVDWNLCTQHWHDKIWEFHRELKNLNIKHIFVNGNNDFTRIPVNEQHNWGKSYIGPYDSTQTFNSIIKSAGIETVAPDSWHFGKDGHSYFARFMLQYIVDNKII